MPPRTHPLAGPIKAGSPSLQRVVLHAFIGTMNPSDSLPAPSTFRLPALYARSLPELEAAEGGSLLFHDLLWKRLPSYPRKGPALPPALREYCLLHFAATLTGPALSNTFRLISLTRLQRSLDVAARTSLLPSGSGGS